MDIAVCDKEPDFEWAMSPQVTDLVIDGSSVSGGLPLPYLWDTVAEVEGPHTIAVTIQPASPAIPPVFDLIEVTVDNTDPDLTLLAPVADTYPAETQMDVMADVTDLIDPTARVVTILLDDEVVFSPFVPEPGDHTLVVIASDIAGNTAEASVSFTVEDIPAVRDWEGF